MKCDYKNCRRNATRRMIFRVWNIDKPPLDERLVQPERYICNQHWNKIKKAIEDIGEIEHWKNVQTYGS
jgi:hypothetical protein